MTFQYLKLLSASLSMLVVVSLFAYAYWHMNLENEWFFAENPYIVISSKTTIDSQLRLIGSRERPRANGYWVPEVTDIKKLDEALPQLETRTFSSNYNSGRLALPVREYYRQYFGIKVNGKKYIYINAVRGQDSIGKALEQLKLRGRANQISVVHCDSLCWGALYDPLTGEFSRLRIDRDYEI